MDEKIKFYNCHHGLAQCEHIEDGRTVYSVVLFEDLNRLMTATETTAGAENIGRKHNEYGI